jgi:hypothetical protein
MNMNIGFSKFGIERQTEFVKAGELVLWFRETNDLDKWTVISNYGY